MQAMQNGRANLNVAQLEWRQMLLAPNPECKFTFWISLSEKLKKVHETIMEVQEVIA